MIFEIEEGGSDGIVILKDRKKTVETRREGGFDRDGMNFGDTVGTKVYTETMATITTAGEKKVENKGH